MGDGGIGYDLTEACFSDVLVRVLTRVHVHANFVLQIRSLTKSKFNQHLTKAACSRGITFNLYIRCQFGKQ